MIMKIADLRPKIETKALKTMPEERFKDWKPPEFDEKGYTKWNWCCQHYQNLKLGYQTDIGAFTYINAKYGVTKGISLPSPTMPW